MRLVGEINRAERHTGSSSRLPHYSLRLLHRQAVHSSFSNGPKYAPSTLSPPPRPVVLPTKIISAAIQELVDLAKERREAAKRGKRLGLSDDELAFYDALGTNDSAVQALGDDTLKAIARELVETIRRNVTIDWTVKESIRAKIRVTVKHLLRKYNYPPDRQDLAVKTILEQSEVLCKDWAA